MFRLVSCFLACLSAAIALVGCGSQQSSVPSGSVSGAAAVRLPALSHNDSLRFRVYYLEAVKQQVGGHFDAAYDLLRHCLDINPNAAEAYFMLSFYDGILESDTVAMADVKKASELNPYNNAYLERLGAGYISMNNLGEATKAYEKLAKNCPERSDVLDILAQLYGRQKDYDKKRRENSPFGRTIMKMYASCPICGYKLCKGESGSDVDILCPRCGKLVRVVITETNTNCTPTDAPKKAIKELN